MGALGLLRHLLLPPPLILLLRNRTHLRSRLHLHRFMSRRYRPRTWSNFTFFSSVMIFTLFITSFPLFGVSYHHFSIAQHYRRDHVFLFYLFFLFFSFSLAYLGGGVYHFLMFWEHLRGWGVFFSFLHGRFGLGFGAYRERSLVFYYFSTFFHVTFLGTFFSHLHLC